ncbi:hypothetical protein CVT24_004749, partial [Panaeolus cyanescens]
RINSSGQVVDVEADPASWELADEIGRLKIGDVNVDPNDVRVAIRTPPKSKLSSAAVNEASPLDSSSNTSVGSSPHVQDHPISHSRGSSADTTNSRDSNTARLVHPTLKMPTTTESKERPHSFSGGLSTADLRRLQQTADSDQYQHQQWSQTTNPEQLTYPSLSNQVHRPVPQQPMFNYPPNSQSIDSDRDDSQFDYNAPQRNFNPISHHPNHASTMNSTPPQFLQGRPNNNITAPTYRQTPRAFPQPHTTTNLAYGTTPAHHTHLSLGNTQQLYEMMLPGPSLDTHHPAVTRVQQQHNVFRATHHHSASDPSALRDAATLALLNNNMQPFAPNMFQAAPLPPPMPLYPNQYYGAATDLVAQQAIAARLQAQYTSPYAIVSGPGAAATPPLPLDNPLGSPTSSNGQSGPSANNRKLGLYKTELCRSWEEKGSCRYGTKCQFAHGEDELRKYKTEICKTFWVSGSCPYGKRCCFIHTELSSVATPASTGTSENTPTQAQQDGRERSNSDPDTSSSVSLLARISQRSQEQNGNNVAATPVDMTSNSTFQFTRPPTGSLRVDTSALDGPSVSKQNKSAYPSFASNGILLPAPEPIPTKSPAPVTAGPDLGRHNLARMEIVGFPSHQKKHSTSSISNSRHSLNGSEGDLTFSPSPPATGHSYGLSSTDSAPNGRVNGHVRGGSAGNWGSFSRSSLSNSTSAFGPSQAGEIMSNSPWSSTELAVGSTRIHEKAWA